MKFIIKLFPPMIVRTWKIKRSEIRRRTIVHVYYNNIYLYQKIYTYNVETWYLCIKKKKKRKKHIGIGVIVIRIHTSVTQQRVVGRTQPTCWLKKRKKQKKSNTYLYILCRLISCRRFVICSEDMVYHNEVALGSRWC